MARRSYAGGAQPTTLASSVNSTTTILSAVALVGWPVPTNPFFAVIDRDTPNEEKVLCQSVNGNDITVLRGQDGTTARDHSAGAPFEHCHTATDADEANAHANSTSAHGAPVGDGFVFRDLAQTVKNKTLDFGVAGGNQATNIPRAASPEIDTAITNEAAARVAGDAALTQADADHLAAVDPHPQYLTPAEGAALIGAAIPPGTVAMFAGAAAPAGWLLCNGTTVSRAAYQALFNVIQTTYGPGDGSTTFGLPDFNGRVPRGTGSNGDNTYALNQAGGSDERTLTAANLPQHAHSITHTHTMAHTHDISHNHRLDFTAAGSSNQNVATGTTGTPTQNGGPVGQPNPDATSGGSSAASTGGSSAANTGNGNGLTGTAIDTRDTFRAIHFIIKT